MLPKRRPFVCPSEKAAALQLRYDEFGEIGEAVGHLRRHDIEAVGPAFFEPFLKVIGDFHGGADELAMALGNDELLPDFPHSHVLALRGLDDPDAAAWKLADVDI